MTSECKHTAESSAASRLVMSIDVEEYFHAEAAIQAGVKREDWESIPSRLAPCVDRILQLLENRGTKATFFILGWIARRQGEVVRRIAAAGHEVASHGMDHRMLNTINTEAFRANLQDSRKVLEDLTGQPVRGYRAPTFSITHKTAWAIDVLAECGFAYDSSVFPIRHDRYGVPDAPRTIHRALGPGGGSVIEFPPTTVRIAGANLPLGGGGYLRLLPVCLLAWALRAAARKGGEAMVYLHPWELDPGQPELPMRRLSKWRHRVNLHKTESKLDYLLSRFPFTRACDVVGRLDPSALPTFQYGREL